MQVIRWSRIESLNEDGIDVDFAEIDRLNDRWLDVRDSVEGSNPTAYEKFNEELARSWAIETGIIEGLYELDRGITQTLIEKGFESEFLTDNRPNKTIGDTITTLRDHRSAIDLIDGWIKESRPLSKWFVKHLHEAITHNQKTYRGLDQFGRPVDVPLRHGQFKQWPNNPTRPDGVVHEYCPPEHVESELEMLTEWYRTYDGTRHPLAVAAWLHHRFAQIHPFEDGNGRVVRALLTWHLVRKNFLPIVITRDDRPAYIAALEEADAGDLSLVVRLLVRLERKTLLKALSVEHGHVPHVDTIDEVIGFYSDKFRMKQREREAELRSVQDVALRLRECAEIVLDDETERIAGQLGERMGWVVEPQLLLGGPEEGNEYYYRREVVETGKDAGHWINFQEPRYFVRATLRKTESVDVASQRSPTMVFVVSIHNIGYGLTGVMAATSFVRFAYPNQPASEDAHASADEGTERDSKICSDEPFLLTVADKADVAKLESRFETWVTNGLSVALRGWLEIVVEQA